MDLNRCESKVPAGGLTCVKVSQVGEEFGGAGQGSSSNRCLTLPGFQAPQAGKLVIPQKGQGELTHTLCFQPPGLDSRGQRSNTKRERGQPVLASLRAPTEIFTSLSQSLDAHFLRASCIRAPTRSMCPAPKKTHKSCPFSFLLSPPLRSEKDLSPPSRPPRTRP